MNLGVIMLSEISQRKLNTVCYHLCVKSKKYTTDYKKIGNRLTDTENKLSYLWEEGQGKGQDRNKGLRDTNYYV